MCRCEVLTLGQHPPSRHQARQSPRQLQLLLEDLRLRSRTHLGLAGAHQHDPRGRHAVLQSSRAAHGSQEVSRLPTCRELTRGSWMMRFLFS